MTNTLERGGSERQFIMLARNLDTRLFSLHLGCLNDVGPFRDEIGMQLSKFPLGGSLYTLQSFRTRFRLARHLRRCRIAIAHAFDFYTNLVLIPVARVARVPVVIGSQRQIGDLLTPAQWRAQLLAFHLCDKVVCNSQAAADRLCRQGLPERKLAVIGNGIPIADFTQASPALPVVPGLQRVGMIARMNHEAKNHSIFLKAAALVASRFSPVEFVLVGDGPLRAGLEQQAIALGIAHLVRFLGDRRDVPAVLASLNLTVLPSSSESLSNSIIESLAAGVTVIATRVGGNTELINSETGVLVEPGDEIALASAMESLLRDETRRRHMACAAKVFAQKHFSTEQMCHGHERLYNELLQTKSQPRAGQ